MAEATNPTAQTGVTAHPFASNAQDFSGSDDDIVDNFAEGPQPGDPPPMGDTHDDGTPLGLGGEKGKQVAPADTTLEADLTKEPEETPPADEEVPSDGPAESEPVPDEGDEVGDEEVPPAEPEEPEAPEFAPALLQMAGYPDAEAAKADGFGTPESLLAYIRGRGELLAPKREGPLYERASDKTPPPTEEVVEEEVKPFEITPEMQEVLDPELVDLVRKMNEHYQGQVQSVRESVAQRLAQQTEQQQEVDESVLFDQVVQNLGEEWHDTYGTGPGADLANRFLRDPTAVASFRNRQDLFESLELVRAGNKANGFAPMTLQQEVLYALQMRHPDKFQQTVSPKPNSKPKSRSTSRPTQRKTPPKTQNEKTVEAVNRVLAKKGSPRLTVPEDDGFDGEI